VRRSEPSLCRPRRVLASSSCQRAQLDDHIYEIVQERDEPIAAWAVIAVGEDGRERFVSRQMSKAQAETMMPGYERWPLPKKSSRPRCNPSKSPAAPRSFRNLPGPDYRPAPRPEPPVARGGRRADHGSRDRCRPPSAGGTAQVALPRLRRPQAHYSSQSILWIPTTILKDLQSVAPGFAAPPTDTSSFGRGRRFRGPAREF
jgi:hypothetical protein